MYRKKIVAVADLSEEKAGRTRRLFSEEERAEASQRLNEYWQ